MDLKNDPIIVFAAGECLRAVIDASTTAFSSLSLYFKVQLHISIIFNASEHADHCPLGMSLTVTLLWLDLSSAA